MAEVRVLHPGCTALAWDGELLAHGFGRRWRWRDGHWRDAGSTPAHAAHHVGEGRQVAEQGGYVYTRTGPTWRATGCTDGDEVLVHPSGAVAFATQGAVHRASRPGRAPVELPEPLDQDSLRFAPDGSAVLGLGPTCGRRVDLATGALRYVTGIPLADGVALVDGDVMVEDTSHHSGLREASPAVGPTHLAGPGGAIWRLSDGQRSAASPIALGVTAPVGDGFATVAFDALDGTWVDHEGSELARFDVPLPADDLLIHLEVVHGMLVGHSAEGRRLELLSDLPPSSGKASHELGTVDTPLGPLSDALLAHHEDRVYACSESGWLLSWSSSGVPMMAPSTSGNS